MVCVRRPSNFARPASVPNHIAPSAPCAIACTRSDGKPWKSVTAPHWCKPVTGVGDGEGEGDGDGLGEGLGDGCSFCEATRNAGNNTSPENNRHNASNTL